MPEKMTAETLSPHLNSVFKVDPGDGNSIDMELTELKDRSSQHQEIFTILLRCPGDQVMPQKIYGIRHDKLGKFDLFLVPVAADDKGVYYEAVFNRLREASE